MTMPDERTRSLIQAGAFLKELSRDSSLPRAVRDEASRLLRHYPTVSTVRLLASVEASRGSNILSEDIDPCWPEQYRFGAHTI